MSTTSIVTVTHDATSPSSEYTRARDAALCGLSAQSRRVYSRHLCEFLTDGRALSREAVISYLDTRQLGTTSHNQALSAIKRLSREAAENGWLPWTVAQSIDGIRSKKVLGTRAGNWLTHTDSKALLALPDIGTLSGLRDRAVLVLLLGCGLRRAELSLLRHSQVQSRNGTLHLIDINGKGNRLRTVAVPVFAADALRAWTLAAGIADGFLIRSFMPDGTVTQRPLCVSSIRNIVLAYAARVGSTGVACTPHDLRRTFAKLARKAGAPLDVIQRSLGHSSVATTELYTASGEEANAGDYLKF